MLMKAFRKRLFPLIIVLVMLFNAGAAFSAEIPISIVVNNRLLKTDVDPLVIEGRTLVPLRAIADALGCTIEWNVQSQTATIRSPVDTIIFRINSYVIVKTSVFDNREDKDIEIDVPPMIVRGRTMVPVRAISEGLDAKVEWIKETNTVTINIDYQWDYLGEFSEDLAQVRKGGKYGLINRQGVMVAPMIYDSISPFKDGFAEVVKDGVKFYIDEKNNQYFKKSDKVQQLK